MKLAKPKLNEIFIITNGPKWPSVIFETDIVGKHTWNWTITWGAFKKSGKETTPGNKWNAQAVITNYGGTLTVRVEAEKAVATTTVKIKGTNPSSTEVSQYLATKANSAGFAKIIAHETKFKHFNVSNEPDKSFDNGYGICQLTTPAPSFEQVWNWKLNIDGGLKLFSQKVTSAIVYLKQNNRNYTSEQLKYESVCRWNGGAYHEWDTKAGKWVRKSIIRCDSKTGNIGWNMDNPENKGKTEAELHTRDSSSYAKSPGEDANWMYSGVCYADRILA